MRLAKYFSDNLIAQRDAAFSVWGFDAAGRVEGRLACGDRVVARAKTQADGQGRFCLEFGPQEGGFEEYVLQVDCEGESVSVQNLRFGDVYLTMGQSNMSYPLSATEGLEEYAARAAENRSVCFLNIPESFATAEGFVNRPATPQEDLCGNYVWQRISDPEAVNVSAVSFLFAVELSERVGVPVGFVHTAMGGVSIDTFLSRKAVDGDQAVRAYLQKTGKYIREDQYNTFGGANYTQLAGIFHEKICPLERVRWKGAIWYQGENSAYDFDTSVYYEHALKLLFSSYRTFFGQPELPFIAIQIAAELYPYGDTYGYLYVNEAIERACRQTAGAWCVPVYDVEPRWLVQNGDLYFHPIHPCNKNALGIRCADVFERNLYRDQPYGFPCFERATRKGSKLRVKIDVKCGTLAHTRTLYGFTVAGADGKYYAARARVSGPDTVTVWSEFVARPEQVTYAFCQYNTVCNLKTECGRPVLPFRTAREPVNGNYYLSPLYPCCDFESVLENNFGYEVGGGMRVPLWKSGALCGSPVRLTFQKASRARGERAIKLTYAADNAGYFYFGAQPNVDVCGQPHHLDGFDFLTLSVRAEAAAQVEFHGALFKKPGGMFKFRPLAGGEPTVFVPVTEAFCDYTVDLRACQSGDEGVLPISPEEKKQIYALELYFRCKSDAVVFIDDLRLNNCPPSDRAKAPLAAVKEPVRTDMQLPT